ncbi:hypothetical protein JS278_00747 [Acidipropionibacterium virtanenii]|uniref:Uncharacterized protein n=1 Tax=Acidipropionibacterium virtanenii TaxID=2057246 RepID=A0A344URP0_9ACTN|nr:hypothetical protein JS278_00747 [Acidipropionibacterium virtanenii]
MATFDLVALVAVCVLTALALLGWTVLLLTRGPGDE